MSTELKHIAVQRGEGCMMAAQFYGGADHGTCIQLTQLIDREWRYIQLTKADAKKVARRLTAWSKKK